MNGSQGLSELTRPTPDERVKAFLIDAGEERVFISVVTLGEICAGIAGHSDEKRRVALQQALDTVMRPWFKGRVLSVTESIAERWGLHMAKTAAKAGRFPLSTASLLRRHWVALINPWEK